ncbi:MAG: glycosyltransferase family 1 protein [Lachnospiraceae bacterium]|nr:glycosyltransferase family 1 protein [Lachnospiraceae bacterium]
MIRVLQCVNNMHRAGLETMLMNYYRSMDRTKLQFDFLTHRPEKSDYDDEILSLGGRVFYAPRLLPQNYPAYFRYMKQFWADHPEYQIVHAHIDSMSYLPLLTAKEAGVPVRIAHSHNTSIDLDYKYPLKLFFKGRLSSVANYRCACGQEAGKFLFGDEDFTVIPNAIDGDRFLFDARTREEMRAELGISQDEFVIGHVGRLCHQKNHRFLLKIFTSVLKQRPNALLLLVGTGEKESAIRRQAQELGIDSRVRFLGSRGNVDQLYQAMDVLVLPSLFEGVPVVGIEAQFSDLPCVFSDKVPNEVKISEKTVFLSLEQPPEVWAEAILDCEKTPRVRGGEAYRSTRYNIENAHSTLEDYYMAIAKTLP